MMPTHGPPFHEPTPTPAAQSARAALEKYGQHREGCDLAICADRSHICSCGLSSALAALADAAPYGPRDLSGTGANAHARAAPEAGAPDHRSLAASLPGRLRVLRDGDGRNPVVMQMHDEQCPHPRPDEAFYLIGECVLTSQDAQLAAALAARETAERERDAWQRRWAIENENLEGVSAELHARLATLSTSGCARKEREDE